MAWKVALVASDQYPLKDLKALIHQMPVWAASTPERADAAKEIWKGNEFLWDPDPTFTLMNQVSGLRAEDIVSSQLGVILDHHPRMAALCLFGAEDSTSLAEAARVWGFEYLATYKGEGILFTTPLSAIEHVPVIELDANGWSTADDFYEAFFSAVGAPAWHGKNFNALRDSVVTGDINKVKVPYRIVVKNSQKMKGEAAVAVVLDAQKLIQQFAVEEGCPVSFEMVK